MSQSMMEDQRGSHSPPEWPSAGFAFGIEWLTIGSTVNTWSRVWFPAGFDYRHGSNGYVIQFRDEPGVFYVTERTTQRSAAIAGPLPTLEAAQLAYLLILGDK